MEENGEPKLFGDVEAWGPRREMGGVWDVRWRTPELEYGRVKLGQLWREAVGWRQ